MYQEEVQPSSPGSFSFGYTEKVPPLMQLFLKNWMYELVPVHPAVKRTYTVIIRGSDTGIPHDYDFEHESRDWEGVVGFSIPKGWGFVRNEEDVWVRTGMKLSALALKIRLMFPRSRSAGRRVFAHPVVNGRIGGRVGFYDAIRRVLADEERYGFSGEIPNGR